MRPKKNQAFRLIWTKHINLIIYIRKLKKYLLFRDLFTRRLYCENHKMLYPLSGPECSTGFIGALLDLSVQVSAAYFSYSNLTTNRLSGTSTLPSLQAPNPRYLACSVPYKLHQCTTRLLCPFLIVQSSTI